MATDWSEAAKAKRSASAKKAAETRKANQAKKTPAAHRRDENAEVRVAHREKIRIPNSRVARWALSGVSIIAMMRANPASIPQRG